MSTIAGPRDPSASARMSMVASTTVYWVAKPTGKHQWTSRPRLHPTRPLLFLDLPSCNLKGGICMTRSRVSQKTPSIHVGTTKGPFDSRRHLRGGLRRA